MVKLLKKASAEDQLILLQHRLQFLIGFFPVQQRKFVQLQLKFKVFIPSSTENCRTFSRDSGSWINC